VAPPPQPAPAKAQEAIGVFPANWAALRVFLNLATQWRHAGADGVPVGLEYAAVPVVAQALDVPADGDLLARLRVLEGEALRVMRVEAERARPRQPVGKA
jgi:hypothetical protein